MRLLYRWATGRLVSGQNPFTSLADKPRSLNIHGRDQQGFTVDDLTVDADAPITEEHRDDLLDGVVTLRIPGHAPAEHVQPAWPYQRLDGPGGATTARDATNVDDVAGLQGATTGLQAGRDVHDVTATAVPYYAWANRGAAPMRVWLPLAR